MRVLSNLSNSFPVVARCVLARDVHVSGPLQFGGLPMEVLDWARVEVGTFLLFE